ncbi:MAG: hypothetical protein LQ347_002556 [Umbilicaria vellea]|nr:MAG: hypothetical protein LQ347_002556 [Umbilicaria vellea]
MEGRKEARKKETESIQVSVIDKMGIWKLTLKSIAHHYSHSGTIHYFYQREISRESGPTTLGSTSPQPLFMIGDTQGLLEPPIPDANPMSPASTFPREKRKEKREKRKEKREKLTSQPSARFQIKSFRSPHNGGAVLGACHAERPYKDGLSALL